MIFTPTISKLFNIPTRRHIKSIRRWKSEENSPPSKLSLTYRDADKALKILRRYNMTIWKRIISIGIVGGGLTYMFKDRIKEFLGRQTVDVVSITIESEDIQDKVRDFSDAMLAQLLEFCSTDEGGLDNTKTSASDFIKRITEDSETIDEAINLGNQVIEDTNFQDRSTRLALDVVNGVLNDQKTTEGLMNVMNNVFAQSETQNFLTNTFSKVMNHPEVLDEIYKLSEKFSSSELLNAKVYDITKEVSKNILNNSETSKKISEYNSLVFNDPEVKEEIGVALWNAFLIALIPSWNRGRMYKKEKKEEKEEKEVAKVTQSESKIDSRISVPEDKLNGAVEILFRECYEQIAPKLGLQLSEEGLKVKKKAFHDELNKKLTNLSAPLRRRFRKYTLEHFDEMFASDRALIDKGGEKALIANGKKRIDAKIEALQSYLDHMVKEEKGLIWHSYSPQQLVDRENTEEMIKNL